MECLSDKPQLDRRMALSYMQEAQITAGLLASHGLNMKQEPGTEKHHRHLSVHHQHHPSTSPPLNNNTTSAAAASLFSGMGAAAAAAASLSMLTPQQFLASHMSLLAAGLPVSLNPSFAASSPSLYRHHQTLFGGWAPPSASSPPSSLPGPVSPALSTKSAQNARRTPNGFNNNNTSSNNNNNNNNVVSSASADRLALKKTSQAGRKKAAKSAAGAVINANGAQVAQQQQQQTVVVKSEAKLTEGPAGSPTSSISPEAGKDGRDKVFTCSICSRSFGYKHVLQNHERTHTGEKPYKCKECHKRFTRDHHLKTHMRLHTGEKPYHCSHCDRQFVQVANLRRHLRVHTGERPYACELCAAKFSDSNQLKAHLLIHKNEKPEKCEHCHMRFRRRHHLLHHKCSAQGLATVSNPVASAGTTTTTILPGSLVTAQLGTARSVASDELEDDVDVDVDAEPMDAESHHQHHHHHHHHLQQYQHHQQQRHLILNTPPSMRQLPSPASLPIGIPVDLPEQTEPEDLSMPASATRMRGADELHHHYSRSHSSGGGSPMSHSPSSETGHDDDEELDEVDDLDVARASPSSLFAPDARRVR